MNKAEFAALDPYAVTFTDGYYSVRQARDKAHAAELSKERHPDRTIESIRQVRSR